MSRKSSKNKNNGTFIILPDTAEHCKRIQGHGITFLLQQIGDNLVGRYTIENSELNCHWTTND